MRTVIDENFLANLELFSLAVKDNVAGLFGGNHKSKRFGSSSEFADYREYIEGDDISKIDWNIYGRSEKMFLKLYLDERQMQTRIYIDASNSMGFYKKDEMAIKLATAFAYLSIKEMDRVSIFAVRGNIVEPILEKVVGKDSFLNVIGQINKIEFGGGSQISDAITNSTVGYGDGRSILISDFLTDNDFFNAIDHLRGKKRDVLCLQVLSEEELHPQIRGKSIIRDSEDMGRFYKDNIGRDMLEAYRKALKHVTKRLEDFCISREADYQLVSTKDELKDILLGQLMKKGVIK
ncbi:MAG: DUF58 domain-containing protein [Candidatus Enteromonas sp.]|jgi:uncharacterized protein (DUF58 family)|nr:DUF58 domain-containing protein [Bacilli bacterium]MEE3299348.1 DUF58 domain-containing protein [Candidatus Enteromonas sp.]MEE3427216.1 DUF58 domain-containing protein [Candidatus Enteromonas sp.]MEE3431574.1 DUF58 domain-containing protein [Candidatus Enteromonas sp.]MEE3442477.1 DUF58 domain-containing protein [Candidatus Enteromonas sp.]